MRVLVGDIGGTKTALGLAEIEGDTVTLTDPRRYPSAEFDSLETILQRYLQETGVQARLGSFAIAGPVEGRHSAPTNLPWVVDADAIETRVNLSSVSLLNDLEAVAWGIPSLQRKDFEEIHPGAPETHGNACVVAAGTGLGEAGLYWDGFQYHPFACEGGHTDFAPENDLEFALFQFLCQRYDHVSWERLVTGMGIASMYEFLQQYRGVASPDWLREQLANGDAAAVIAQAAASRRCPVCMETMELFFRLYGREAGNMALKQMALGGVYLAGGIAPSNLEMLRSSAFLAAFFHKGRMEPVMRRMPVRVILQPHTPLFGAARFLLAQ